MSENGNNSRKKELDSFWDIERIVPARRSVPQRKTKSTDTVEITVSSVLENINEGEVFNSSKITVSDIAARNIYGGQKQSPILLEYEPQNSLIHKVRIYDMPSQYRYYEEFYKTAKSLRERKVDSAEYYPFFSYVPQYDQLNEKQLDYYLYFRGKAEKGEFVRADLSYVLLYAYEIINLGEYIDTKRGQAMLYSLWVEYGKQYPKLHKQLIEWLCDYSLIHKLSPPKDVDIHTVADVSALKEFFVTQSGNDYTDYAEILLAFSSSYDYRKSKFAIGENKVLFDEHVIAALAACVKHLSSGSILSGLGFCDSTLPRDAYAGALCCYNAKKKIEIDFCSFSRTNELRYIVGEIVKYSENKIRAHIGVKSRLSCYLLDNDLKAIIDAYFSRTLVRYNRPRRNEKREEYEALYDLPKAPLSLSGAKLIEEQSWETTRKLVEAFECNENIEKTEIIEPVDTAKEKTEKSNEESDSLSDALGELYGFALAVYTNDYEAQRREAQRLGKMPDSIVDSINERSFDFFGDILIEDNGEGLEIVEDYRSYFD